MDPSIEINQRVDVVVVYRKHGDVSSLCMPFRMRFKSQEIEFIELGLRHPTTAGKRMLHIFDMSDGVNDYRLSFDAEALTWTLVAMIEGRNVRD